MAEQPHHIDSDALDEERAGYHHGDLPATLMELALEHIDAHGTEKLSLRALAREAGVSATAPYRHFPTKQCLLAALATQGFEKLRAYKDAALDPQDPIEERFVAMGVSYIQFALENPVTYQLMFGSVLADFSQYEMLRTAAERSYEIVDETLSELLAEVAPDVDVEQFGGVVWASVHGMASLLLTKGQDPGPMPSKPTRSLAVIKQDPEAALRLLYAGFLSTAKKSA